MPEREEKKVDINKMSQLPEEERSLVIASQAAEALSSMVEPLWGSATKLRDMVRLSDGSHPDRPEMRRMPAITRPTLLLEGTLKLQQFLANPENINVIIALTEATSFSPDRMVELARNLLAQDQVGKKMAKKVFDSKSWLRRLQLTLMAGTQQPKEGILTILGPLADVPHVEVIVEMMAWYAKVVVDTDGCLADTIRRLKEHEVRLKSNSKEVAELEDIWKKADQKRQATNQQVAELLKRGLAAKVIEGDGSAITETQSMGQIADLVARSTQSQLENSEATIEALQNSFALQRRIDNMSTHEDLRRTLLIRCAALLQARQCGIRGMDLTLQSLNRVLSAAMRTYESAYALTLQAVVQRDLSALQEATDQVSQILDGNLKMLQGMLESSHDLGNDQSSSPTVING